MPFNAMGWREYMSFLMEEARAMWNRISSGHDARSFSFERNQDRLNNFFFVPQYSFCRISRK
jgi:hypothetical protein